MRILLSLPVYAEHHSGASTSCVTFYMGGAFSKCKTQITKELHQKLLWGLSVAPFFIAQDQQ